MSRKTDQPIEWDESFGMSMEEFNQAISDSSLVNAVRPGDKISGKVIAISDTTVFIDVNAKSEGIVPTEEFIDDNGQLEVKLGDIITATVVFSDDEIRLSYRLRKKDQSLEMIQEAFRGNIPVEGRVEKTNKGGFEVDLGTINAFCPISQIDLDYVDNPDSYIGATCHFLIVQMESHGRNIVVSRKKYLENERQKLARELLRNLSVGDLVTGNVKRITDFGVFVDIGGIDALVPISHIAWERIHHPSETIALNQEVRAKVLEINPETKQISLSIRDAVLSPWEQYVGTDIVENGAYPGQVVRVEKFGAFIRLKPGLEGLLHISEIESDRKINHPSDKLKIGDIIQVNVIEIDTEKHRLALSMTQQEPVIPKDYQNQESPGFGSLRLHLQKALEKKQRSQ